MTRRRWAILVGAVILGGGLLWFVFGREPIEEGRCKLVRRKVKPSGELARLASQVLEPQMSKPPGLQDLPAGFDNPCFYELRSDGKPVSLVVNLSEEPVLCLDMDGDGVLSEEQRFPPTRVCEIKGAAESWRFGPISLAPGDNPNGADDGGFYLNCYTQEAIVRPAFCRTGKLKLEGRTYRVLVADGDCDGRFHSILSWPFAGHWQLPGSDVFAIDLNRNGKFDSEWFLPKGSEIVPLGRLVRVGNVNVYYAIEIAPDGTSLALSRTEPQFGTLAIEPNNTTVQIGLWSDAAYQRLRGCRWQLPAGKYQGIHADVQLKDAAGDVWSFSCDLGAPVPYPLGAMKFFTIEPGQTTRLRFGPPFVVTADVQQNGPEVSIGSAISGCGGERYRSSIQRNGQLLPKQTFKIVDEKGTVLETGKFEYG